MTLAADLSELLDDQHEEPAPPARISSIDDCGLSGWYWYCGEHDAHGIADSEDEAVFVLDAHVEYHELHGQGCPPTDLVIIFQRPASNEEEPGADGGLTARTNS